MSTTAHTPTPWTFKQDPRTGDCGFSADGTGIFIENFSDIRYAGESNRAESRANAEFIITAVNSHDALTARIAEQEKRIAELQHIVESQHGSLAADRDLLGERDKRIDALKAALEPFVLVEERDIGEDEGDGDLFKPMLSNNRAPRLVVGDFRRARAALTEGECV